MHRLKEELGNIDERKLTPEVAERLEKLKKMVNDIIDAFAEVQRQIKRKGPKTFVEMSKDESDNDYYKRVLYDLWFIENVETRLKKESPQSIISKMLSKSKEEEANNKFPSDKFIHSLAV